MPIHNKTKLIIKIVLGIFYTFLFLAMYILTTSYENNINGDSKLTLIIVSIISGLGVLILTIVQGIRGDV